MKIWLYAASLVATFAGGCTVSEQMKSAAMAEEMPERPAYLIISVNEVHPDKMEPYKQAAGALSKKLAGGTTLIGAAQPQDIQVLEGTWNFPGLLIIERFKSMKDLKRFWYSNEYQEVKKLREGHTKTNFFVAIEGQPLTN